MQKKEHTVGPNAIFVEERIPAEQKFPHPLVLVPGSFGGYSMWNMVADFMAGEQGFHCFVMSLRGHKPSGDVNLGQVGMADYVADVESVTGELGIEKPVVIGHSMAGLIVLMYAKNNPTSAVVSIGPSPSLEVQGAGDEEKIKEIPLVYTAMDAGMPSDPAEAAKAMPDVPQEVMMKLMMMLGPESGKARQDRKRGVSVPKETITVPVLILGGEIADSLPFGVPPESSRKMAEYYDADFVEIKGATHPGIIMGVHAGETAKHVAGWLKEQVS